MSTSTFIRTEKKEKRSLTLNAKPFGHSFECNQSTDFLKQNPHVSYSVYSVQGCFHFLLVLLHIHIEKTHSQQLLATS